MEDKIHIFLNGDVLFHNNSLNIDLLKALNYMYENHKDLLTFKIFNIVDTLYLSRVSTIPFTFEETLTIPPSLSKMYHLIDNRYEVLCNWDRNCGKAIACDLVKDSRKPWEGFTLYSNMTEEEYISLFKKTTHLY